MMQRVVIGVLIILNIAAIIAIGVRFMNAPADSSQEVMTEKEATSTVSSSSLPVRKPAKSPDSEESREEKQSVERAPRRVLQDFLGEVKAGNIREASRYNSTSSVPENASSLRDVVEKYRLTGLQTFQVTSATTSADRARLKGSITRRDNSTAEFIADLYSFEGRWIIDTFLVIKTTVPTGKADISTTTVRSLAGESLGILADSLETDNYEPFYEHIGEAWAENTSAEELEEAYSALSEEETQQVIDAITEHEFTITKEPTYTQNGDVRFDVTYTDAPLTLVAELTYKKQDGAWRLVAVNLRDADAS